MDKSLSLGMPMLPQGYIQEVQASNLGDAQGIPFFINKNIRFLFQYTIFLLLHILFVVLGASLFLFSVLFSLVCCSSWLLHTMFVWERDTLRFHCLEHSSFIPITLRVFSFLLALPLVFVLFRTFKFFLVVRCVQLSDL